MYIYIYVYSCGIKITMLMVYLLKRLKKKTSTSDKFQPSHLLLQPGLTLHGCGGRQVRRHLIVVMSGYWLLITVHDGDYIMIYI